MIIVRRQIRSCIRDIYRTLIAERIPHYKERSALLPGGLNTPFPIVVEPDIDLVILQALLKGLVFVFKTRKKVILYLFSYIG